MLAGTLGMVLAGGLLVRGLSLRLTLLVSETALVLPALLALLLWPLPLGRALRLDPLDWRLLLLSFLGGAALWVASLGLLELQYAVWMPDPGYFERFRLIHQALRPKDAFDALVSVAVIAAVPAVCEEILLRGTLLPSLDRAMGPSLAVLISAGLFGLIHFDAFRFLFTFGVGLALGVVRLRAGSLTPPILIHATLNTLTFLAVPYLDDPTVPPAPRPGLGATLLLAGALVGTLVLRPLRRPPCA